SVVDVPSILPDERVFPRPVVSDPPRFTGTDEVWSTSNAIYVDSNLDVGPLTFLFGARAEYTTYYDQQRTSLDPRFAVRAKLLPFTTLKANLGQYHQAASAFFLAKQAGNPDLPLERGWQSGVGVETWLTRSLDVDAQLFYRTADDLAEPVGGVTSFVATGAPRVQPIGHERAYGFELLIRQRLDKGFFGWVSYTLMRAEERLDKAVGVEGSTATGWRSTEFDQTHNISVAASLQLPLGFEVGAAVRYVTGNPATLAQGGVFDADDGRYERVDAPVRSSRLPPFFQLDARIDKRFTFDAWSLGLYCDLQNATNRQNYELFQYSYDFSAVQGFPGLPILPVIGAEARF
ncbi:MAG TPA: TonB-dependent receptor, partial [Myxococcota bacterium]